MDDQPHFEPLERSDFYPDGRSARPLPEGTVARGHLRLDAAYFTGKTDGKPVEEIPARVLDKQTRRELLEHGRARFDIYCVPCHSRLGDGNGMVARRGFPHPPTYHSARLRGEPIGHFFDVMTKGFGRMPAYDDQIPTADRWAIAAYVRALQYSQGVPVSDLPAEDRKALEELPVEQERATD